MSGGAPTHDRSLERRVSQLERELRSTQRALDRQANRLFRHAWPRDVRLARTVSGGESYPGTSGNTFYVELLDSHFPAVVGDQTPTHYERGERLVAHVLGGGYVDEGTECFVLHSRGLGPAGSGEYWIWPQSGESSTAQIKSFTALENWRKNAGSPRVWATDGITPRWLYLPRTRSGDPNVVSGATVVGAELSGGSWSAVSDYMDDAIGTVKMWVGTAATIPAGWKLMDGTSNGVGNGGTGFNFLADGFDRFPRATDSDMAVGEVGGSETAIVPEHADIDISDLIADHEAKNTGDAGGHSHGGSTGASSGSTGAGSGSTGSSTTGISQTDAAHPSLVPSVVEVESGSGSNVLDGISSDEHQHGITDPGHTHTIGSHTHDLGSHTHTISSEAAHNHSISAYVHSATESFDLEHDPVDIINPYLYVMFIERVDNSAGD